MSTALRIASADYSKGPGDHVFPLVAREALTFGYDFSQPGTDWKAGLVAGQSATTGVLDFDGQKETAGDGGWARALSGGVKVYGYGVIRFGGTDASKPIVANDGVGVTFMLLGGATSEPPQTYSPILYLQSLFLGEYSNAGLFETVGAGVSSGFQPQLGIGMAPRKPARNSLIILRCDGANNWDLIVPNTAYRQRMTSAQLGVPNPYSPTGGATAQVQIGVGRTDSQLWRHNELEVWIAAGWNRALTDAEIAAQYQRLRLHFPGVL